MAGENDQDNSQDENSGPSQDDFVALQRENAFLKAGIDTSSVLGGMFAKTYEGELDAEKVLEAAKAVPGLIAEPETPSTTTTTDEPDPDAAALTDTLNAVGAGAGAADASETTAPAPDRALDEFQSLRKQGRPTREAATGFVGTLMTAAANGDQSAIFDRERWLADQGHTPGS